MKKLTYIAGLLPLLFAACEDVNDKIDGLDEIVQNNKLVVDNSISYTLTDDDYKTIGGYNESEALDEADLDELKLLASGSVKAFSSVEFARKYIGKFIASKWYVLDKGSSLKITYNLASAEDATYKSVLSASSVTLSSADYSSAGSTTGYLTPSTESKLPAVIASNVSSANEGDYCVVSYSYSSVEPSSSEEQTTGSHWTALELSNLPAGSSWAFNRVTSSIADTYAGQKIRLGLRYTSTSTKAGTIEVANFRVDKGDYLYPTIFVKGTNGEVSVLTKKVSEGDILILGKVGDEYYALDKINDSSSKGYGYSTTAAVSVTNGVVSSDDFEANKLTIAADGDGFTIKNTDGNYLWHQGTFNSFQYKSDLPADDHAGYVWKFTFTGATAKIVNESTGFTIALGSQYKSYGVYAESKLAAYLESSLLGSELPDGFSIVDVNLSEGLTYVWSPGTSYVKASAFKSSTNYESESWIVSPEIDLSSVSTSASFSLDVAANKFDSTPVSDGFQVFVSSDYVEGNDFVVDGTKSLKAAVATETLYKVYYFNGSKWVEATDAIIVSPSDYALMGLSNTNFSKTSYPDAFLPKFLDLKYPYASEEDKICVAYHYYDGTKTSLCADNYVYTAGAWAKVSPNAITEPFAYSTSGWVWNPSLTLTLTAGKNNSVSAPYYQAIVDWVWKNIDKPLGSTKQGDGSKGSGDGKGYTSAYGTNEYYTGASSYNSNMDWRTASAVGQYKEGFEGMDDDQILATMQKNFIHVFGIVLGNFYPDADVVEGVDVIYTINFVAYFGSTKNYTVKYKVIDKATFEYVEDSLQPAE